MRPVSDEEWNARFPVGTEVIFHRPHRPDVETTTSGPAYRFHRLLLTCCVPLATGEKAPLGQVEPKVSPDPA